jgi:hypothetical protein
MTVGQPITFRPRSKSFVTLFNQMLEMTNSSRSELITKAAEEGLVQASKQLVKERKDAEARGLAQLREAVAIVESSTGSTAPSRDTSGKAPSAAGIADSVLPEVVAAARKPRKP